MARRQSKSTVQPENSNIIFTPVQNSSVITVSGNNGSPLFSIKPNGEFVPGPGLDEGAISEFANTFYKKMTIFGKSFSETLEDKNRRIRDLEEEVKQLKNQNGSLD
jgi:hypothetical protein